MSSGRQKQRTLRPLPSVVAIVSLCFTAFLVATFQGPIRAKQGSSSDERTPVLKGTEIVEITGNVVAMSQDTWAFPYYSSYILLLRVDKVLSGKERGHFVRAEFEDHSIYTDSKEAQAYRRIESSLREEKTWKIRLRPPRGFPECLKIPPPPTSGDLTTAGNPVFLPVGGASGYPDINTVPCYVIDLNDIQELGSSKKSK